MLVFIIRARALPDAHSGDHAFAHSDGHFFTYGIWVDHGDMDHRLLGLLQAELLLGGQGQRQRSRAFLRCRDGRSPHRPERAFSVRPWWHCCQLLEQPAFRRQ